MFSSERKIIGVSVADVEQALTEQYGRASLHELGRSQASVTYRIRVTSRSLAQATILPNPNGATLRLAPYNSGILIVLYSVLIIIGLVCFIIPGFLIAFFWLFKTWVLSTVIGRHIDNIARGAEHQAKLFKANSQPPPLP